MYGRAAKANICSLIGHQVSTGNVSKPHSRAFARQSIDRYPRADPRTKALTTGTHAKQQYVATLRRSRSARPPSDRPRRGIRSGSGRLPTSAGGPPPRRRRGTCRAGSSLHCDESRDDERSRLGGEQLSTRGVIWVSGIRCRDDRAGVEEKTTLTSDWSGLGLPGRRVTPSTAPTG